ncbi:MAG: MFS transporter [Gammaproteobacteria bacterium]|nr:MFS transporter [Gammaproteobacteria bacterium]MCY4217981.1 MFS transporter [Gammaproteobacteria bacterium]MCY4275767.1 MFS transporter [Gammaproteobacteria bacterium]
MAFINDMPTSGVTNNWASAVRTFLHPRVITMLFLGFSAGLPLMLIFSSLSLWLREAGIERSVVTFFSWAALGYSFKFVWAPLADSLSLPYLTNKLGRRRAWILLAQISVVIAILLMSFIDPASGSHNLVYLALAAVMLGFSSATQDIVIDAYRIESAKPELQAMMSSSYIVGYRIGMLVTGAGSLYLASALGTTAENYSYDAWSSTYQVMAACMSVGIVTTMIIKEPEISGKIEKHGTQQHIQILLLFGLCVSSFIGAYLLTVDIGIVIGEMLKEITGNIALAGVLVGLVRLLLASTAALIMGKLLISFRVVPQEIMASLYFEPVADFFRRYGIRFSLILLVLIGCYRISDIVLGVISNVFYQDLGFSKTDIANASKFFGLWMTLIGGFFGGLLAVRVGVLKILFLGAVLSAATNLMFILLAKMGQSLVMLYAVIMADNLSAGLASAAFVAFLSSLTNVRFSAMQYAIFTSFMFMLPKILGGYSGSMVDTIGYENFFLVTAIIGLPVLFLIWLIRRQPDQIGNS